ncbi:MAG: hypothetical protein JO033_17920 [Acidobacteriaceae bacterium]|nr:hypothetical protein [Acidobacteriaceae bacterium]MBV9499492.1 hypothetical protein [Acidobacteriaceae bacterium]
MAGAEATNGNYEERAALYYPYIHIRNENWLKSALLAFQKVHRIVPNRFTLSDNNVIQPYLALVDKKGNPLLDQARIYSDRVQRAQNDLFENLKKHERTLVKRYSEKRTPEEYRTGAKAFQVHRMKILNFTFSDWLVEKKLAWNTRGVQEHDTFDWLTMHPQMGAAIMSVLALAIAKQDGLKVVTPSPEAHNALLAGTQKQVFDRLLQVPALPDDEIGEQLVVQELCQVVLATGFDLTRLKPEDIRDIVVEGGRELRKFYGKLSSFVTHIPAGIDEKQRDDLLKAKAEEVLEDWRGCVKKLPQLQEALKDAVTDKGLEKAVDLAKDAIGAHSFALFLGGFKGVALAVAVKAGSKLMRAREAPYPFLNRVEEAVDKRIGYLYVPQWRELAA